MNKGKICVPVTGETAEEMLDAIARAAEFADVIELRIDSLGRAEIGPFFEKLKRANRTEAFLITFRPKQEGGYSESTLEDRQKFWASGRDGFWGGDFEEDVIQDSRARSIKNRIYSYHNFERTPENLNAIYKKLAASNPEIVKIAVQTNDVADGLPLWNILRETRKDFIPIAMGDAGKWTRIMGPAFGAPLTYGALETGKETAPGQITARDLKEVYRVKELTEQTKVFGVIGDPVSKSLSPYMHNPAFKAKDIDAVFMHLEVKDLDRFIQAFIPGSGLNFGGLSVTMPHKQAIIQYLDEIGPTAKAIGAVNTVKIENGKLFGFNTDAHGFIEPLKGAYGDLKNARAALLGAGGAARACAYGLKQEGAEVTVLVRDIEKCNAFAKEFGLEVKELSAYESGRFDLVVNATPLGMKPGQENFTLLSEDQLEGVRLVFDLITKPAETALIRNAKKAGIQTIGGVEMLVAQGIRQFEIWTGEEAPKDVMRGAVIEVLNKESSR